MDRLENTDDNIGSFSEASLRKTLVNLDRKYEENQKLRIKHHDNPAKFASSETELYATLNELQNLGTQPELYHVISTKKAVYTLLNLIGHENTDISGKVIHMLQEFTDTEADDDAEAEATERARLIDAFLSEDIVESIVSNLSRFDDSNEEESLAISRSLDILDNLVNYRSAIACDKPIDTLLSWMINQIKTKKEFNPTKGSMIEFLSTLLINSSDTKLKLVELGGLGVLLEQVAHYRRVAPETGDEREYLEQLIDCLCMSVLNCDQNRTVFFEEEGVDLVIVILRERREAVKKSNIKLCMLKLFSNVLTTDKDQDPVVTQCCERFIEALGLGVIFPLFLNPKLLLSVKTKRREYRETLRQAREHTSAVILALLKHCRTSEFIQRILIKFAENQFSKFMRVVDLHDEYFEVIQNRDSDDVDESSNEGFILGTIDYMIMLICFLSQQFETYDPISGETFSSFIVSLLSHRPELGFQITLEAEKQLDELAQDSASRNSLKFLLGEFEKLKSRADHEWQEEEEET